MKRIFRTAIVLLFSLFLSASHKNAIKIAIPTRQQLAFQDLELGVFIHYSIDTYSNTGAPPGQTPASAFNPTSLDPEQWVLAAKAMGATYVVLTARHEQGFCLWPTQTTNYSIKYSPYKEGKGDIVRAFVEACKKHGLKPGLYTAPWIDAHWETTEAGLKNNDLGRIDKLDDPRLYNRALQKEKQQLKELMTNYGPLVFIWDDHFGRSDALDNEYHGGKLRELYASVTHYAHDLQPHCLLLGRDIEHIGNEEGRASYPLWNALNTIDGTLYSVSDTYKWNRNNTGKPLGKFYRPQIGSTTNALSSGGWMWTSPRKVKPLESQMKAYYETVGRGAGLIINMTPDRSGLIPEDIVAAAQKFGLEIKQRFGHAIASSGSKASTQVLRFNATKTFDHIVTMEDLSRGQKIANYVIEAEVNGKWKVIVQGQTIGHKRIDQVPPVKATAIRFQVTNCLIKPAVMKNISVFNVFGSTE